MNDSSENGGVHPGEKATLAAHRRGVCWWLSVAEVRLRLIGLICVALLVATQWGRLQSWSRDVWHRWFGHGIEAAVSPDTEFFCPMDPTVVTDWPAICPICNMDLVPRKKSDAQLLPEGVVARMQLTPYRIQLAGIRTSAVVPMELVDEITLFGVLTEGDGEALLLETAISRADIELFNEPRAVTVSLSEEPRASIEATSELLLPEGGGDALNDIPRVRITIADAGDDFTFGAHVRAVVRIPVSTLESADEETPPNDAGNAEDESPDTTGDSLVLTIPQSAVVDHGYQQLVFVETMAGMFDAVTVDLGRRCGDYYPVLGGLEAGDRIVVNGAFLIDAETRLNPSLAVQYFGANQASDAGRVPELRVAGTTSELSPEDLALAEEQAICPVTGKPLDSMGGPVLVLVEGRKVFICCRGCEHALTSDPDKYLERPSSND